MIMAEVEINNFKIITEKGKYGPDDFVVKAKFKGGRWFTPKHAHFVIDFYGKLCYDREIGEKVFDAITRIRDGEFPESVLSSIEGEEIRRINVSPGYPLEYILYALWLLFEQEDINHPPAAGQRGRDQTYQLFKDIIEGVHPVNAMRKAGLKIVGGY